MKEFDVNKITGLIDQEEMEAAEQEFDTFKEIVKNGHFGNDLFVGVAQTFVRYSYAFVTNQPKKGTADYEQYMKDRDEFIKRKTEETKAVNSTFMQYVNTLRLRIENNKDDYYKITIRDAYQGYIAYCKENGVEFEYHEKPKVEYEAGSDEWYKAERDMAQEKFTELMNNDDFGPDFLHDFALWYSGMYNSNPYMPVDKKDYNRYLNDHESYVEEQAKILLENEFFCQNAISLKKDLKELHEADSYFILDPDTIDRLFFKVKSFLDKTQKNNEVFDWLKGDSEIDVREITKADIEFKSFKEAVKDPNKTTQDIILLLANVAARQKYSRINDRPGKEDEDYNLMIEDYDGFIRRQAYKLIDENFVKYTQNLVQRLNGGGDKFAVEMSAYDLIVQLQKFYRENATTPLGKAENDFYKFKNEAEDLDEQVELFARSMVRRKYAYEKPDPNDIYYDDYINDYEKFISEKAGELVNKDTKKYVRKNYFSLGDDELDKITLEDAYKEFNDYFGLGINQVNADAPKNVAPVNNNINAEEAKQLAYAYSEYKDVKYAILLSLEDSVKKLKLVAKQKNKELGEEGTGSDLYRNMAVALKNCVDKLKDPASDAKSIADALLTLQTESAIYKEERSSVFGKRGDGKIRYDEAGIWAGVHTDHLLLNFDKSVEKLVAAGQKNNIHFKDVDNIENESALLTDSNVKFWTLKAVGVDHETKLPKRPVEYVQNYLEGNNISIEQAEIIEKLKKLSGNKLEIRGFGKERVFTEKTLEGLTTSDLAKNCVAKSLYDRIMRPDVNIDDINDIKNKLDKDNLFEKEVEKLNKSKVFARVCEKRPKDYYKLWNRVNELSDELMLESKEYLDGIHDTMAKVEHANNESKALYSEYILPTQLKLDEIKDPVEVQNIMDASYYRMTQIITSKLVAGNEDFARGVCLDAVMRNTSTFDIMDKFRRDVKSYLESKNVLKDVMQNGNVNRNKLEQLVTDGSLLKKVAANMDKKAENARKEELAKRAAANKKAEQAKKKGASVQKNNKPQSAKVPGKK